MTGNQQFCLVIVDQVARILRMAVKYGCYLGLGYLLYLCVVEMAGKTTVVDVAANFFLRTAKGGVVGLSLGFAFAASLWAYAERRTRQLKVQKLSDRIIDLERKVDPNRTSSGLTRSGLTHPEDDQG
ncbi:hypothetical protein [Roseococcus sp. YIM B11640]|uniref:hypothetical protein n=1 Tax=Roseococcus sp. YIM B11640 TaxID=3133973 RepID=UPI003C7A9A34